MRNEGPAILRIQAECFVIMGAAIKPDGRPSGAMQRRVEGALLSSQNSIGPYYIVTGGQGKFGPPESDVMKLMLQEAGVPEAQIITDPKSNDTLSSILECAVILKDRDYLHPVVVCTDRYHVPRCRWLFRLLGIATEKRPMPSGRGVNGNFRWSYYHIRELFAILWDTFALGSRQSIHGLRNPSSGNRS